jgi:hypothetical protein
MSGSRIIENPFRLPGSNRLWLVLRLAVLAAMFAWWFVAACAR